MEWDHPLPGVKRNGFWYGYGRMSAMPERVLFQTGEVLRHWFLPDVSIHPILSMGSAATVEDCVRGVLKHYTIKLPRQLLTVAELNTLNEENEENKDHGSTYIRARALEKSTQQLRDKRAITFLQETLMAGGCDKVPESIKKLRLEMHRQWLAEVNASVIGQYPQYVLEKYFLKEGADKAVGNEWLGEDPVALKSAYSFSGGIIELPELIKEEDIDRTKVLGNGKCTLLPDFKPERKTKDKARGKIGDEDDEAVNVVVVPVVQTGYYGSDLLRMRRMAETVPGLHHTVVQPRQTVASASELESLGYDVSPMNRVLFGWDKKQVDIAARRLQQQVDDAAMYEENTRVTRLEKRHRAYLKRLARRAFPPPDDCTIVGKYQIRCDEIEFQWPQHASKMWLAVRQTKTLGLFEAEFNFGAIEGVMLLSAHRNLVKKRSDELRWTEEDEPGWSDEDEPPPFELDEEDEDEEDEEDEDEDEDEDEEDEDKDEDEEIEEDDEKVHAATFEKNTISSGEDAGPSKEAKTVEDMALADDTTTIPAGPSEPTQRLQYYTRFMCRATIEGEVEPMPEDGKITFTDDRFVAFVGFSNMLFIGRELYTGQKISDAPGHAKYSWQTFQNDE